MGQRAYSYGLLVGLVVVLAGLVLLAAGAIGFIGDEAGVAAQEEPDGILSEPSNLTDAHATFVGNASDDAAGYDVTAVEDLNGDGNHEVVVTAPFVDTDENETDAAPGEDAGAVYVFYGPVDAGQLNVTEANVTLYGAAGDRAGEAVAGGNLTDGNGSDLVVGAPYNDTTGENTGVVYVVNWSETVEEAGAPEDQDQGQEEEQEQVRVDLTTEADAVYEGGDAEEYAGYSLATVPARNETDDGQAFDAGSGDEDDGDDGPAEENETLVVGAPFANTTAEGAGAAYLLTDVNETRDETSNDTVNDTQALATAANVTFAGVGADDGVGWAVADAGDVTGDGAHEIIVGAPFNDTAQGGPNAGAAYVLSTDYEEPVDDDDQLDREALVEEPLSVEPDDSVVIPVDEGLTLEGLGATDRTGFSVATAGNLTAAGTEAFDADDGDVDAEEDDRRIDSVVVGAPFNDTVDARTDGEGPANDSGAAYVVHGDDDLELEGNLSLADANVTLRGESSGDRAGWAVAGGEQLICDGSDDVVVGAPYNNATRDLSGAAYVVAGSGLATGEEPVERSLSPSDGKLNGTGPNDRAGWAVAPANDSTGDNNHDVLVGAPYNTTYEYAGAAYLVEGDCPVAPEDAEPTPEPGTPTPTPTETPEPEPTPTPTETPEPTPTPTPEEPPIPAPPTPTPTETPEPEPTPTPTETPEPEPTPTPTETPGEPTPTETPGEPTPTPPDGEIDECTTIDEPGEYQLTSDLEEREEAVCIEITSGDVVLEGNDNLVQGVGADESVGVHVVGPEGEDIGNVTVRNLQVENWHDGVKVGSLDAGTEAVDIEGVEATDNGQHGVYAEGLGVDVELVDVTASGNGGVGINSFEANIGVLRGVTAEDNGGDGIMFFDSGPIDVEDVTVSGNDGSGMSLGNANTLDGQEVTATDNGEHGIDVGLDSSVDLDESTIAGNQGSGIRVSEGALTLRNSVVEDNDEHGISLSLGSVELDSTSLRENAGWELYSETDGVATASDLSIGDAAVLDFDEQGISLDAVPEDELPATPEDAEAVGDALEVDGVDSANATLEYDADRVEDEEVELWRHDGDSWESVGTYEADGTITEELTADGVYAPVETETEDPAAAIEFVDCQSVQINDDVPEVEIGTELYDELGLDSSSSTFTDVEAGTTFEDIAPEGVNGYYVGFVSLYDDEGEHLATERHPDEEACADDIRPERPAFEFVEGEQTGEDEIEVTFGYTDTNNIGWQPALSYIEGTTDDEPPQEIEPGENQFTATWTPESDDERLVLEVDLTAFGYEGEEAIIRVESPPASEFLDEESEQTPTAEPEDDGDAATEEEGEPTPTQEPEEEEEAEPTPTPEPQDDGTGGTEEGNETA